MPIARVFIATQKGFAPIILITVIVGSLLLLSAGYLLGKKDNTLPNQPPVNNSSFTTNNIPGPTPTSPPGQKCKEYKQLSDDELYTKYTVRSGDSVLAVARNQLGDSSRYGEIIQLNKDRYPYIENSSFLEIGMTLYLPDKHASAGNYLIGGVSGKIANITNEYFGVTNEKATGTTYIYQGRSPQFASNFAFKVGDCVTVKYFTGEQIPYSVVLQP